MKIPKLHVGRGEHRAGVTLFPIWHANTVIDDVTAATDNTVAITELGSPEVERLRITSTSDQPVLLVDGDILIGGKQDRMLIGSRLLAPGRTVVVEVRCVEQDRWNEGQRHTVGTRRASSYVRGQVEQGEVWRRVHVESQNHSIRPNPEDFAQMPGQSGVLIGIAGRPTLLELFGNHSMLESHWTLILQAAADEAAGRPDQPTTGHSARSFIRKVDQLRVQSHPDTGGGVSVTARADKLELRGVIYDGRLLQASIINHQEVSV